MSTIQEPHSAGTDAEKKPEASSSSDADRDRSVPNPVPGLRKYHADAIDADADADEALKVFRGQAHETSTTLTPEEEKKLLRKIDWNMMPLLCIVYGLNYLDKTTLSYASIMGLKKDINIDGSQYSWVASVFYFGYLAWEWPTTRLLQRLPLAKWSAFNVIMWGGILCCMAGVKNYAEAIVVRFLLGVFEAAVSPGFALFTTQWWTLREQGSRTAIWFSFNGWGQIIGGLIAYGIAVGAEHTQWAVKSWQLMFLVIGLFTMVMGVLFLILMPDSQLNAGFLTERERIMAVERIRVNQQGVGNKHFKKHQFYEALTDPVALSFFFYSLIINIPNGGISNFFSQLLVSFGWSPKQSLLLGIPGGGLEIVAILASGYLGDRFQNRILFGSIGLMIGMIGMILIIALDSSKTRVGRLIGYYLVNATPTSIVSILSLISTNVAGWTKKTTVAAMFFIGYCVGNLIGPQVFQQKDAPRYLPGEITIIVCWTVTLMITYFIYWSYKKENRRRAAIRAQPGYVKVEGQEFFDLTDRENPEFVYAV